MKYREGLIYIQLEKIIKNAGVQIVYDKVFSDHIDGDIWARCDIEGCSILMPDTEEFPDDQTACLTLGHEMGHILSGLESTDEPIERKYNEAECDQIGVYLYKLAEMTAGYEAEKKFRDACTN